MRLGRSCAHLTLTAILLGTACMRSRTPLPDAASFSIVGFGDSLTVGGAPGASYLSHLPPEWSPTNRGGWGEFGTTGHGRLQRAIPSLVHHDVEIVVMMWGTSDAYSPLFELNGPTEWRDELVSKTVSSIEQLIAAGITPVVAFPPPSLDPSPEGALANARLEELEWLIAMESIARDVAFVDLYAAFRAEPDPSVYFAADGIHLNAAGGAFAARQIEQVVATLYEVAARRGCAPSARCLRRPASVPAELRDRDAGRDPHRVDRRHAQPACRRGTTPCAEFFESARAPWLESRRAYL